jgi:hypothetical protein
MFRANVALAGLVVDMINGNHDSGSVRQAERTVDAGPTG